MQVQTWWRLSSSKFLIRMAAIFCSRTALEEGSFIDLLYLPDWCIDNLEQKSFVNFSAFKQFDDWLENAQCMGGQEWELLT